MFLRCFFSTALLIITQFSFHAQAQKKTERQIARLETQAAQLYESKLFHEALPVYQTLDSISPNNPEYEFRLGLIHYYGMDKARSSHYFVSARENGKIDPNLDFYMARAFHFSLQFDSAVLYYHRALNAPDTVEKVDNATLFSIEKFIQDCRTAKKLTQDSLLTPIINIGEIINTRYPEYVPLVNENESMIIFTSRRPDTKGRRKDKFGIFMEDIYISYYKNDEWSKPTNDLPFNTPGHDACVGLSPDGTKLIFYRSDNGGDLYISENKGGKWSDPVAISGINSSNWESSACITSDGKYMFFTSDRPGGYGGSDIYRAELLENGRYGNIENLGFDINTERDEDAPQIHIDGKTLFFSSKGWKGMGGYDIYSSVYNKNSDLWSKPKNIGYPINTPDDDIYFSLLSNGTKGFFSSYRYDSKGEKDLYMITRPGSLSASFLMKFKLFDPYTNRPINAQLTVTDKKSMESFVLEAKDTLKGKYSVALEFDKKYLLNINASGYGFKEKEISINHRADVFEYIMNVVPSREEVITLVDSVEVIDDKEPVKPGGITSTTGVTGSEATVYRRRDSELPGVSNPATINSDPTTIKNIDSGVLPIESVQEEKERIVQSLEVNNSDAKIKKIIESEPEVIFVTRIDTYQKLVIPIVNFQKNSFELDKRMEGPLVDVSDFLKLNREVEVIIYGHTDITGNKDYNKRLSVNRARTVKEFLIKHGVNNMQLNIYGFGEDLPLLNNKSVIGRMLNRRVTMTFIDSTDPKYTQSPYMELINDFDIDITPETNHYKRYITWEKLPVAVHFQENRADYITEYSAEKLVYLANYIKNVPYKLVLIGFDSEDENASDKLAVNRASIVYKFMKENGVNEDQLMILDRSAINNIYDVISETSEINKRKVQFFLVKD